MGKVCHNILMSVRERALYGYWRWSGGFRPQWGCVWIWILCVHEVLFIFIWTKLLSWTYSKYPCNQSCSSRLRFTGSSCKKNWICHLCSILWLLCFKYTVWLHICSRDGLNLKMQSWRWAAILKIVSMIIENVMFYSIAEPGIGETDSIEESWVRL